MNKQSRDSKINSMSIALASYMTLKTIKAVTEENDIMSLPTTGDRMTSAAMVSDIVTDSVQNAIIARG